MYKPILLVLCLIFLVAVFNSSYIPTKTSANQSQKSPPNHLVNPTHIQMIPTMYPNYSAPVLPPISAKSITACGIMYLS